MPLAPSKLDKIINRIIKATQDERDYVQKGSLYDILTAEVEDVHVRVRLRPPRGRRAGAIDESLEEAQAVWGDEHQDRGRGKVAFAELDERAIIVRMWSGRLPKIGDPVWLYPRDFLTPLLEMWRTPDTRRAAKELLVGAGRVSALSAKQLPDSIAILRDRQKKAVQAALHQCSMVLGSPGTPTPKRAAAAQQDDPSLTASTTRRRKSRERALAVTSRRMV